MLVTTALVCCLVSVALSKNISPSTSRDSPFERFGRVIKKIHEDPRLRTQADIQYARIADVEDNVSRRVSSFNCAGNFRSANVPTSVNRLQVGDIDVVGAIGDSLTAANGAAASTIIGCLTEYRHHAWSAGGATGSHTEYLLPNILKQFNPNLYGFSTSSGSSTSSGAHMNVAVPGSIAQDMPQQAEILKNKMMESSNVDYANSWKMITVFIGGNNLCAYCDDLAAHNERTYIDNVRNALDILYTIPRSYINLVEIFDIAPVAQLGTGFICGLVHNSVCSCGHGSNANIPELSALARKYQQETQNLMNSGRYSGRSDRTVILQPFLRNTVPPSKSDGSPDLSYFAPDCFHFSKKGHNMAGKGLWNNLLQPIGSKGLDWNLNASAACPSSGTYLPVPR